MKPYLLVVFIATSVLTIFFGCDLVNTSASDPDDHGSKKIEPYPITISTKPMSYIYETDRSGEPCWMHNGECTYHPVWMTRAGLNSISKWIRTENRETLGRAQVIAGALLAGADTTKEYGQEVLWYPYPFDYTSTVLGERYSINAPWYSGMAQGMVLSLYARLYAATGDTLYRNAAKMSANALHIERTVQPEQSVRPSVTHFEDGYYWIDEYVTKPRKNVYNGMIFALIGLMDARDALGLEVNEEINAALRTIRSQKDSIRNPGGYSFYAARHRGKRELYHGIHIQQFRTLARRTGSSHWGAFADSLIADDSVYAEYLDY